VSPPLQDSAALSAANTTDDALVASGCEALVAAIAGTPLPPAAWYRVSG
jgi:hypothetical protein